MEFLYRINDMIPEIFSEIIRTYNFKYMRIDGLHSVLAKDNYAISMSVNKDYVDIYFFHREEAIIVKYWLQPFLMENLDDDDRSVARDGDDIETSIINYLLIYEKVLRTKWQNILMGQKDWVEKYDDKSYMRLIREFNAKEYDRYKSVFQN